MENRSLFAQTSTQNSNNDFPPSVFMIIKNPLITASYLINVYLSWLEQKLKIMLPPFSLLKLSWKVRHKTSIEAHCARKKKKLKTGFVEMFFVIHTKSKFWPPLSQLGLSFPKIWLIIILTWFIQNMDFLSHNFYLYLKILTFSWDIIFFCPRNFVFLSQNLTFFSSNINFSFHHINLISVFRDSALSRSVWVAAGAIISSDWGLLGNPQRLTECFLLYLHHSTNRWSLHLEPSHLKHRGPPANRWVPLSFSSILRVTL